MLDGAAVCGTRTCEGRPSASAPWAVAADVWLPTTRLAYCVAVFPSLRPRVLVAHAVAPVHCMLMIELNWKTIMRGTNAAVGATRKKNKSKKACILLYSLLYSLLCNW